MAQVRDKAVIPAHRHTSHEKSHPDRTASETIYNNTNEIKSTTQEESIIQYLTPVGVKGCGRLRSINRTKRTRPDFIKNVKCGTLKKQILAMSLLGGKHFKICIRSVNNLLFDQLILLL